MTVAGPRPDSRFVRFGIFEFDPQTGDLFKAGRRIRLQDQPRQVLTMLIERPGELVTREDVRSRLWSSDTFVDFDTGLNVIVNKIRQALDDSASAPRFIETLPRRGYRFIAPVTIAAAAEPLVEPGVAPPHASPLPAWRRGMLVAVGAALLAIGIAGAWSWRVDRRTASEPRVRTLAVLPLENLSTDAADDYFADGMTDALVTDLASVRSLNVIARQSTKRYKGSTKPVSAIARELGGVDFVVEGSVMRTGGRVRLIVQLIDAYTDRHTWARTYEADIADVLQLQHDAARTVAAEIRAVLTPQEHARLGSVRQVRPDAHDAYLRGRYILGAKPTTPANTGQALAEFQRATELDPNYAPAYVGIAEAQLIRGTFFGGQPPLDTRPPAFRAARRALQLDPDLGEAHGIMGRLQLSEFDWLGADGSFARMRELAPGYAPGLVWDAYHLLLQGRLDEALEIVKRAETLDPLNLNVRVSDGFLQSFARKYESSVALFEQVLALDPDNLNARGFLVTAAAQLGRPDKSLAAATDAIARHGRFPLTIARLAYARGRAGDRSAAEALIGELLDRAKREYVAPGHLAFAYAALGERDRAFEWFERAYEERSNMMMFYPVEPMFEWRDDPRYVRLVAKIRQPHAVRDAP